MAEIETAGRVVVAGEQVWASPRSVEA